MANGSSNRTVAAALPLNPREFLILLSLAGGAQHGYGILKTVATESGDAVRLDPANLYRVLRRLERDGLVKETRSAGDEARRRTYALTGFGRRVVTAEADRLDRLAAAARARNLIRRPGSLR